MKNIGIINGVVRPIEKRLQTLFHFVGGARVGLLDVRLGSAHFKDYEMWCPSDLRDNVFCEHLF